MINYLATRYALHKIKKKYKIETSRHYMYAANFHVISEFLNIWNDYISRTIFVGRQDI